METDKSIALSLKYPEALISAAVTVELLKEMEVTDYQLMKIGQHVRIMVKKNESEACFTMEALMHGTSEDALEAWGSIQEEWKLIPREHNIIYRERCRRIDFITNVTSILRMKGFEIPASFILQ